MFWEAGLKQAVVKHLILNQRLEYYKILGKGKKRWVYNKNQKTLACHVFARGREREKKCQTLAKTEGAQEENKWGM